MVNRFVASCAVLVAALTWSAPASALVFPFHEPPEMLGAVADEVVALDFDGNGWRDVAGVSRATGKATLVRNHADGFDSPQTATLPGNAAGTVAVAGGDLDGDGRDELLAALGDSGSLVVFRGRADGGLGVPYELALRPAKPLQAAAVAVADMDGDGDRDVLAAFGTSATVLANDGHGALTPTAGAVAVPAPYDLALVKLAGDDDPDLVVTSAYALTLVPGAAGTGFGTPVTRDLPYEPAALATGDVNGDGRLDVGVTYAWTHDHPEAPGLFSGTADGDLTPLPWTAQTAYALLLADFDGDGITDRYANDYSATFAHGAAGTFGRFDAGVSKGPSWERGLAAADFDGDGKLDVVSAQSDSAALNVRYSTGPQLVTSAANTWFGEGVVGTEGGSMIAIPVRNEGGGVARNLELIAEGDTADFHVEMNTCRGAVLRVEENCWLNVYFRPKALGARTADIGVAAEDSDIVWLARIEGTGVEGQSPAPTTMPITGTVTFGDRPPVVRLPARTPPPKAVRPGAPALTRATLATLRRSGLRFTQQFGTAERVTWTLEHRRTVLARAQRTVAAGSTTVTLKLTASGKRVLTSRKPTSLTLRTTGTIERVTTVRVRRS
ncbi:VCBS repeat protein [Solirubrobacter pauli]|uniref:VCBS repeat protein n=1 Tax=Solirubrobacter pauli TaxID=166793 RepID=A0A660KZ74_9ACTN|nr:VCBS repeat-containing protein [Solirubrobacter pauli]RKQ85982.1 VCBS repeat protein [Solirubrobacter pauli]